MKIRKIRREPRRGGFIDIHNACKALPDFWFPGIQVYADRALTNEGGVVFVASGLFDADSAGCGQVEYYRRIGIGADWIIEVDVTDDGDLYKAILTDKNAKLEIFNLVRCYGLKIRFFNTREGIEETFVSELGLRWEQHVVSIPSWLADLGNNKAWVRRESARRLSLIGIFPPHHIASGLGVLFAYLLMRVFFWKDELIVKLPNWASTLGQLYTRSVRKVLSYMREHWKRLVDVIVEQNVGPHISLTIVRRYEDGRVVDEWCSEQMIVRINGKAEDVGRTIARQMLNVEDEDIVWLRQQADQLDPLIRDQMHNFTGVINWDGVRSLTTGQRNILEANVRETFSSYVREIQHQVALLCGYNGVNDVVVTQVKIAPQRALSFTELEVRLGDLLFDPARGLSGVIPIVVRCLESADHYCYFVAVGRTCQETMMTIGQVCEALEDGNLLQAVRAQEEAAFAA